MNRTLPLILTAALLLTACASAVPIQPADATTSPPPQRPPRHNLTPQRPPHHSPPPKPPPRRLPPNSPSAIFSPSLRTKTAAPSGTPATRSMSFGTPAI